MIIYATKKTVDRYKLKMPEELENAVMRHIVLDVFEKEKGDALLEWGAKIFYIDGRKCLQVCNFASKFTIVLVDIKVGDLETVGEFIAQYMMDIYADDSEMIALLERYFKESPRLCFAKLQDRRVMASLNYIQSSYLEDWYRLDIYIMDEIFQTRELNRDINKKYLFSDKIDGKKRYFLPAERFAALLKKRYGRKQSKSEFFR